MFEVYGIDVRGLESNSLDPSFIALLVSQLPQNARVWAAIDERAGYSIDQVLLNNIEYMLRLWIYSHTEDAKFQTNRPRPVISLMTEDTKDPNFKWTDLDEMASFMKEINGI